MLLSYADIRVELPIPAGAEFKLLIGKSKGPVLRGLASRAPYFPSSMSPTLDALVGFYNARFTIGLTSQEQSDLVAFLRAL